MIAPIRGLMQRIWKRHEITATRQREHHQEAASERWSLIEVFVKGRPRRGGNAERPHVVSAQRHTTRAKRRITLLSLGDLQPYVHPRTPQLSSVAKFSMTGTNDLDDGVARCTHKSCTH
jgi:hypothetical protein